MQDLHNLPTNIVDELELSDIHLIEQYILGKEEMEAQEMEESVVELPDKQEIDREMVVLSKMPENTSCEQEECVEMKTCDMSLPKLFKSKESVHTDRIKLEMPKIDEVVVKELPRIIKLEKPIEQDKSKLYPQQKVLGSKVIREENPIKLVKGEIYRSPPKPSDRQNSLNLRHETKKGIVKPYKNKKESQEAQKIDRGLNYRPLQSYLIYLMPMEK